MCLCVCGPNGCLEEFHLIADLWQVTLTIPRFAIGTLYCQGRHLSSQIPQDNWDNSRQKGRSPEQTREKVWRSISEYWSSVASLLLSTSHIDHLLLSTSPTLKPRGALFSITPCVKHSIWSPDKRTSYIVRNYYKNLSLLVCKLHYFQNIILMGLIVWGLFFRRKKYME